MSSLPASGQPAHVVDNDEAGMSQSVSLLHIAEISESAPNIPDTAMSSISNTAAPTALLPEPGQASTSIKLPVELLHPILVALAKAGSFRALAICARTCRLMYDLALPYIYQDVYLGTAESFDALLAALESIDRYCSLAKEDRTRQPPIWTSVAATPGQRLIENFKVTRRITLGDLPDGLYCRRLRIALRKLFEEQGSYGIVPLFPNAKLLKIAPIEPYPAGHTAERMHTFSDPLHETPHFLDQICRPEHVCLFDIYGSAAERYSLIEHTQYTFYDYLTHCHLTEQTWEDTGIQPVLSWHGPLRRRDSLAPPDDVGIVAARIHRKPIPQIFSEIRLYLDNQVDMSHVDAVDFADGSAGDESLETTLELEWAYTLWSSIPATFASFQPWRSLGYPAKPFIINIDILDCFGDHVRLRPVFSGTFTSETRQAVIRSAIAGLKIFGRSDSLTCPVALLDDLCRASQTLQQLNQSCEAGVIWSAQHDTDLSKVLAEAQHIIDLAVLEAPGLDQQSLSAAINQLGALMCVCAELETYRDVRIGDAQVGCPVCEYCPLWTNKIQDVVA